MLFLRWVLSQSTIHGCHLSRKPFHVPNIDAWAPPVQFSSRWYLCARESPYALHPALRSFPMALPCLALTESGWRCCSELLHAFSFDCLHGSVARSSNRKARSTRCSRLVFWWWWWWWWCFSWCFVCGGGGGFFVVVWFGLVFCLFVCLFVFVFVVVGGFFVCLFLLLLLG